MPVEYNFVVSPLRIATTLQDSKASLVMVRARLARGIRHLVAVIALAAISFFAAPPNASADKRSHKEHEHKEHEHKKSQSENTQKRLLQGIDKKIEEVKEMLGSLPAPTPTPAPAPVPGGDGQLQIDTLSQQVESLSQQVVTLNQQVGTVTQAVCLALDPDKALSLPPGMCSRPGVS